MKLDEAQESFPRGNQRSFRREARGDPSARELCISWNQGSCVCQKDFCRYRHGCEGLHRRIDHQFGSNDRQPRSVRAWPSQNKHFNDRTPREHYSEVLNVSTGPAVVPPNFLFNFPINVEFLASQLSSYSDRSRVNYLIKIGDKQLSFGLRTS